MEEWHFQASKALWNSWSVSAAYFNRILRLLQNLIIETPGRDMKYTVHPVINNIH